MNLQDSSTDGTTNTTDNSTLDADQKIEAPPDAIMMIKDVKVSIHQDAQESISEVAQEFHSDDER